MYKKYFKRMIDVVISLICLPIFAVIFVVIAPIIWLEDKGAIFYNAPRLGERGKVFKMYKFRSMKENAPDIRNTDGSTYNAEDDPRVTKIGRFLRKSSLDETPQIINVLKGDMSLIGPRAHIITNYNGLKSLPRKKQIRLNVKPGITGYSQAYYRNSATADEKIDQDIYYVENLSFLLDVKIFFKTIVTVLKRENIYVSS